MLDEDGPQESRLEMWLVTLADEFVALQQIAAEHRERQNDVDVI
jgi:hypothetical protein